jgi:hypothetical protein
MMSRLACALVAGLALLALGGCGSAGDRSAARTAAKRFYAALDRGDGRAACAELSSDASQELAKSEKAPCSEAVMGLREPHARIVRVVVFQGSAKVDLSGGKSLFLDDESDGWRISAAGCEPQGQEPYDCELEA